MTTIEMLLSLASGLQATTYGWSEMMCGDVGSPRICAKGAVTASGEEFDPAVASAAIAAPARLVLRPQWVWLRLADGPFKCVRIRLNDKSNPRWIGRRGFDLSPAAVRRLTGAVPSSAWSGRVHVCD